MMKNACILFLLFCFMHTAQSQTITFGIESALSTSFISFSSSNELPQPLSIKKGIGVNLSGNLTLTYTNFSIRNKLGLQFNKFKYLPGLLSTDEHGHMLSETDKPVANLSSYLTSVFTYDTESGFYLGTGINLNYLIISRVKTFGHYLEDQPTEVEWIRNYQYRGLGISIPLVMGIEWKKSAIFINYFLGLTDKNKKIFSITEREKVINLGYRYTFNK